jgi:large subunit ribosomal protein L20
MARVKRSNAKRQRHKKWLKRATGFRGTRRTVFKRAKEAVLKAGQHAYHDRRKRKSEMRQGWQTKINVAARQSGLSYSRLVHRLRQANVELDRKVLAQLAQNHPDIFKAIIAETAKK